MDSFKPAPLGGEPRSSLSTFSTTLQNQENDTLSYELFLRYADETKRYFSAPNNLEISYKEPSKYLRDIFPEANLEER